MSRAQKVQADARRLRSKPVEHRCKHPRLPPLLCLASQRAVHLLPRVPIAPLCSAARSTRASRPSIISILAFNSLDAQREACEAYIKSQAHDGWRLVDDRFDDGGLSGASLERPALQTLLEQVRSQKIDIIVVYKVDRLTRSLADFAKLVELFDAHDVSFVSVTQSFNTTLSIGRLTLNVLLWFAADCVISQLLGTLNCSCF
jgi:hypothetical protein